MKIKTETFNDKVLGAEKEELFSISNDNHVIFEILRNKMYSNPLAAMCREVACNSRDANRENGKGDVPIKISMIDPNMLMSVSHTSIMFEDEGIGISPDRMSDIFLKYGNSTKREDDIATGGFGLGAKTPFAYNDTFTVITVCDYEGQRIKYTYTAMIDSTQKGKMVLFDTEETTENTGTKIVVPVREGDKYNVEREVVRAIEYWPIQPELKGFDRTHEVTPVWFGGEGFRIIHNTNMEFFITIDGIFYPCNTSDLGLDYRTTNGLSSQNLCTILDFENGQLTISANREQLQYDESTKTLIKDRILSIQEQLKPLVDAYVSDSESYLDACIRFGQLNSNDSSWSDPSDEDDFKGRLIRGIISWNDLKVGKVEFEGKKLKTSLGATTYKLFYVHYDEYTGKTKYDEVGQIRRELTELPIYMLDCKKNGRRNKTLFGDNLDQSFYLMQELESTDSKFIAKKMEECELLGELGIEITGNYSDVEMKAISKSSTTTKSGYYKKTNDVNVKVKKFHNAHKNIWNSTTLEYHRDIDEMVDVKDGLYIVVDSLLNAPKESVNQWNAQLVLKQYPTRPIYMINEKSYKNYGKSLEIIDKTFLVETAKKLEKDAVQKLSATKLSNLNLSGVSLIKSIGRFDILPQEIQDAYTAQKEDSTKTTMSEYMANRVLKFTDYDLEKLNAFDQEAVDKMLAEFDLQYPMLRGFLESNSWQVRNGNMDADIAIQIEKYFELF